MRNVWVMVCLLACACAPVPDSGAVVTLQPMSPQARAEREAALTGGPSAGPAVTGAPLQAATGSQSGLSDDGTFTGGPVSQPAAAPAPQSYEVVAPAPLPSRPANTGPSVVGFALQTSHPVGQAVYGRASPSPERAARACGRYASPDLAQAAFLRAGGPASDDQGLDPDGDGYACGWDPAPFRRAIR